MRNQLIHRERDGVLRDKREHTEPKAKDGDAHAGEGLVSVGGLLLVISFLGPLEPILKQWVPERLHDFVTMDLVL